MLADVAVDRRLDLFWQLVHFTNCQKTQKSSTDNPQGYIQCPKCREYGKFAFSPRGAHCFRSSCDYRASIYGFAECVGYRNGGVYVSPVAPQRRDKAPARWTQNPQFHLNQYVSAPDVLERWQAYKPVNLDTIIEYQLGVGVLPASQCRHRRLVVPLFEDGRIVGFRGRSIDCDCPKWLTCGSSKTILFGLDKISRGDIVYWLENMIDAALLMQISTAGYKAVASTAGAGTWRDFIEPLAAKRPRAVVVALDNDLAGQPSQSAREILIQEHIAKHGTVPNEGLNGIKIVNALARARVPVTMYKWSETAPPRADGFYLLQTLDNR